MKHETVQFSFSSPNVLIDAAPSEDPRSVITLTPCGVIKSVSVQSLSPQQRSSSVSLLSHLARSSWLFLVVFLFASIGGMVILSPNFVGSVDLRLFGDSFQLIIEKKIK